MSGTKTVGIIKLTIGLLLIGFAVVAGVMVWAPPITGDEFYDYAIVAVSFGIGIELLALAFVNLALGKSFEDLGVVGRFLTFASGTVAWGAFVLATVFRFVDTL